jgi:predicted transcriptional regulator YheO
VNRDIVGSYFTRSESGKLFKSITILIRNRKSDPIGMLCVNLDISALSPIFYSISLPTSRERARRRAFSHGDWRPRPHLPERMHGAVREDQGVSASERTA